jgi:redox-sensing transcriptional repressor
VVFDPNVSRNQNVSLRTVERLSVYRRALEELEHESIEYIPSHRLAALVGVTPAQLRRDLASFGSFGSVARGYEVRQMVQTISAIIGTDRVQDVAIVGVGHLGRALLSYPGFEERGFHIVAAFDVDPQKVGHVFAGKRCHSLEDLETLVPALGIRILLLTSRPEGLQELVNRAAAAGVRGFLNFVPKLIDCPAGCYIEPIDISAKLEKLSFLSRWGKEPSEQSSETVNGGVVPTKKVLVVDDDRDLVASVEAFLKSRGYLVATAHNGKEAYANIIKDRPDLIVLDVMMDYDEEGMVLASALKTDGPTRDIPILMLSGFNAQEGVRERVIGSLMGQEMPAEMFLQKPVRLAELAARIDLLLGREEEDRS